MTTASMLAVVEDAAVVGDLLHRRRADDLGGLQQPRLVDVADRDHLVAGQPLQQRHQPAGAAAGADDADADSVVRALGAGGGETGAQRQTGSGSQERTACDRHGSSSDAYLTSYQLPATSRQPQPRAASCRPASRQPPVACRLSLCRLPIR